MTTVRAKLGATDLVELGARSCGRGKFRRSGYRRKDGTRVSPACVRKGKR